MDIALVGFTRSYNDFQWFDMASAWMAAHEPALPWTTAARSIFDLQGAAGRDFLQDDGTYDAVVLFAIYNPPSGSRELERSLGRRRGQTSLAPNHSREAWVDRLSRTGAKHLIVFRRDESVDGEWLGEIDGYHKLPEPPGVFGMTVYIRKA